MSTKGDHLEEPVLAAAAETGAEPGGDGAPAEASAHPPDEPRHDRTRLTPSPTPEVGRGSSPPARDTTPVFYSQSVRLSVPTQVGRSSHAVGEGEIDHLLRGEAPNPRYENLRELGSGGMGRVLLVRDRLLNRQVALKTPLPQVLEQKIFTDAFIHEAVVTSRLEHPNIVPVYDLVIHEGRIGYVMRRVNGSRLSQILRRMADKDPGTLESFGRVRLLNIFQQIVSAVAFAHDHRVIHRDLKPSNVMIGAYGEVQVLDWGLARVTGPGGSGLLGAKVGQPPYMAPELYHGNEAHIDHRSDIYALGAVLYELLTLAPIHLPRRGESSDAFMTRCLTEPVAPASARRPDLGITPGLDEICARCLQPSPQDRYQRAADLLSDVVTVLEGTREREFRARAAADAVKEARNHQARYYGLLGEVRALSRERRRVAATVKAWDSFAVKEKLWELEDALRRADNELAVAFHETENAYRQASGHDGTNEDARQGLLEFYYQRFLREEEEDGGGRRYFEGRVRAFGDESYARRLQGDGRLRLETAPAGAHAVLCRYEEQRRVLCPVDPLPLGETPLERTLPMGSYLILIESQGYRTVRQPIRVGRLANVELRVPLYTHEEIGDGFVYIPPGFYRRGGDFRGINSHEAEDVWVDAFAMARFPVTSAEYLTFLNAIRERDPAAAARLAPHQDGKAVWAGGGATPYEIPAQDRDGDPWEPMTPICRVNWYQATEYARWAGEQAGRPYRLPWSDEWEKAARGVDGRIFPWGNHWDAGFCKNRDTRLGRNRPEVVGSISQDESPYGVRDMAGNMSDWCFNQGADGGEMRIIRGGSWAALETSCHVASCYEDRADRSRVTLGIRLCFSLPRR